MAGIVHESTPRTPSSPSISSIESILTIPEPSIQPFYKPIDYPKVLAQIHVELESSPPGEVSNLYLLQYQVFQGLGESKLMRKSIRSARQQSTTVHEKIVFAAWLKYLSPSSKIASDILVSCGKSYGFEAVNIPSEFPVRKAISRNLDAAEPSSPVDPVFSESSVTPGKEAAELLEYALEENSPILSASCLQLLLQELPQSLNYPKVVELLSCQDKQKEAVLTGSSSLFLYTFLHEVVMDYDPYSDRAVIFSKKLMESAKTSQQKMIAFHKLGCVKFLRKDYDEAEELFKSALLEGHIYSAVGLARISHVRGYKHLSSVKISSIISSSSNPIGWMYQERSLYCEGDQKWKDLEKATKLDQILVYPYMFRAASLMKKQDVTGAIAEINRILEFKLVLECLELRFWFYLALQDYKLAICDLHVILTVSASYKLLDGRFAATQLRLLEHEHAERWTVADYWIQLYDKYSSGDDLGSLSVLYKMLELDEANGSLYHRQYCHLYSFCSDASMRSLELASRHAFSESERLVYDGWILCYYGFQEEGIQKAEKSINLQRSFEAFFLKAYAQADLIQDPSLSSPVILLYEEALKCPTDRLRKGTALNNLGIAYVDCGQLDPAADCFNKALNFGYIRAHQGLALIHSLRNNRTAAYNEMTKLIEKGKRKACSYEKRADYGDHELKMADLQIATSLDPLLVYPYRYRAAVLMDDVMEKEAAAIAEISSLIAFKVDPDLLRSRAGFHAEIGDIPSALRDYRATLLLDPDDHKILELIKHLKSQESLICIQRVLSELDLS